MSTSVTIQFGPEDVGVRHIPFASGDFHVLNIGLTSIYITRAELDALQRALDEIRAEMDITDMTVGELVEVYGR